MRKFSWILLLTSITTLSQNLVLTGIVDGPLIGGTPKTIELYAREDIPDLSNYGLGSVTNGGGKSKIEFELSGSAVRGQYIYVSREKIGFEAFFGFSPDFVDNVANINGNDAIELFYKSAKDEIAKVYETYGDIAVDGKGEPWEYTNGWAVKKTVSQKESFGFDQNQWIFSGKNALTGAQNNEAALTPFPIRQFDRTLTTRDEFSGRNEVTVYPNSSKGGILYINDASQKLKEVRFFDSSGRYLGDQRIINQSIDVTNFRSGIYYLQFDGNRTTRSLRIIVN